MKTKTILFNLASFCVVIIILQTGCQQEKLAEPREVWESATVRAVVEAVDYEKRELTLRGTRGNVITFIVDERVKRLNEIHIGDEVVADYYVLLATEIRKPTAEEIEAPLTVIEGAGKTLPGVGGVRQIKAVVTVIGIDRPAEMITVKGPLGRYLAIHVADPARLKRLRMGDTIVVTFTEAIAVSVEKAR